MTGRVILRPMPVGRMLVPPDQQTGVYHCVSRVVDLRAVFDAPQKDYFAHLLREAEEYCEIRILTYCIMANHFHVLVEVPKAPEPDALPTPERVLAKLSKLSGHQHLHLVRQRFDELRKARDEEGMAEYLATFQARTRNVSQFMKLLKQRFTLWYNRHAGRVGTLWEDRFKSLLVEAQGPALITMAAYIDLNPVRSGLVTDPKDYPWCGFGEAASGKKRAKDGIRAVVTGLQRGREETHAKSMELYRGWMFPDEKERAAKADDKRSTSETPTREAVVEALQNNEQLPVSDYLRCRVRYFTAGAAFGSKEYVEGVFNANRNRFSKKRQSGARKLKGLDTSDTSDVFVLRSLQKKVFG